MQLVWRIAQVIIPVFFIVAVGYVYTRRARPDYSGFNRIVLDVLTPLVVYTALAGREFRLADHAALLAGSALLILLTGAAAWVVARATGTASRTLVPVVMFTNCGNMGLPLALLAFGPAGFGAAVALFSISNVIHFSIGARITSAHASTRELLLSPLMIASALGMESAPDDKVTVMSMRAAANQFGYLLGAALGGLALAAGGFGALGAALCAMFVAGALLHVAPSLRAEPAAAEAAA